MNIPLTQRQRKRPRVLPPALNTNAQRRYGGVHTKEEAVRSLKYRTDFRLYHLWNEDLSNMLDKQLSLTVVYKSSKGIVFHWPVRTYGHFDSDKRFWVDCYFIEDHGPSFKNLNNLIECYETKQYCDTTEIDVFKCTKTH